MQIRVDWDELNVAHESVESVSALYDEYLRSLGMDGTVEISELSSESLNRLPGRALKETEGLFGKYKNDSRLDERFGDAIRSIRTLPPFRELELVIFNGRVARLEFMRLRAEFMKFLNDTIEKAGFKIFKHAIDDPVKFSEALRDSVLKEVGFDIESSSTVVLASVVNDPDHVVRMTAEIMIRRLYKRALVKFGFQKMMQLFDRDRINVDELKLVNPVLYNFLLNEVMLSEMEEKFGDCLSRKISEESGQARFTLTSSGRNAITGLKPALKAALGKHELAYILEIVKQGQNLSIRDGANLVTNGTRYSVLKTRIEEKLSVIGLSYEDRQMDVGVSIVSGISVASETRKRG